MLAVADKNKDGRIPVEGIETLLRNIGASDRMSRAEIETILSEEENPTPKSSSVVSWNLFRILTYYC